MGLFSRFKAKISVANQKPQSKTSVKDVVCLSYTFLSEFDSPYRFEKLGSEIGTKETNNVNDVQKTRGVKSSKLPKALKTAKSYEIISESSSESPSVKKLSSSSFNIAKENVIRAPIKLRPTPKLPSESAKKTDENDKVVSKTKEVTPKQKPNTRPQRKSATFNESVDIIPENLKVNKLSSGSFKEDELPEKPKEPRTILKQSTKYAVRKSLSSSFNESKDNDTPRVKPLRKQPVPVEAPRVKLLKKQPVPVTDEPTDDNDFQTPKEINNKDKMYENINNYHQSYDTQSTLIHMTASHEDNYETTPEVTPKDGGRANFLKNITEPEEFEVNFVQHKNIPSVEETEDELSIDENYEKPEISGYSSTAAKIFFGDDDDDDDEIYEPVFLSPKGLKNGDDSSF